MAKQVRSLKACIYVLVGMFPWLNSAATLLEKSSATIGSASAACFQRLGDMQMLQKRRQRTFISVNHIKSDRSSRSSEWFVNGYICACFHLRVCTRHQPQISSVHEVMLGVVVGDVQHVEAPADNRVQTGVLECVHQCDYSVEVSVR